MAEFDWAGTDAKHPVKSLPPFTLAMEFTMSRVWPGARSRAPVEDVMTVSRAVHPPRDVIGSELAWPVCGPEARPSR